MHKLHLSRSTPFIIQVINAEYWMKYKPKSFVILCNTFIWQSSQQQCTWNDGLIQDLSNTCHKNMKTYIKYLTGAVMLSIHLNQIQSSWTLVWNVYSLSVRLRPVKIFFSSEFKTTTSEGKLTVNFQWTVMYQIIIIMTQLHICLICQESKISYSCFIICGPNSVSMKYKPNYSLTFFIHSSQVSFVILICGIDNLKCIFHS